MKERIMNIANILGAFVFVIITAVFYFKPNRYYGAGIKVLGFAAAVLVIALLCFILKNKDKLPKLPCVTLRRAYIVTAAALFVLQLLYVLSVNYAPVSDGKYLDIICRNIIDGRSTYFSLEAYQTHYLERYSNQWGLFLLQTLLYKTVRAVFGYIPKLTAPLAAMACMQLSFFLVYKLADKLFKRRAHKILGMLAVLLNPVLFAYSCIFYSDVVSMPFLLAAVYFGILAAESIGRKRFLLFSALTAIAVGIGFCIKGSVAVAGVALIIYLFFKVNIKRSLCFTAAAVLGLAGIVFAERQIMYCSNIITPDGVESYGFPMSHWVMMGLNGRGGYNDDSFMFTYSQPDKQTRDAACREKISATLSDMGISGMAKHIVDKLNYTWSGGVYQLTWQLSNTADSPAKRFFGGSAAFLWIAFTVQDILILLMTVSFLLSALHCRTDDLYLLRLTALGLVLFLLLWETRSRYMINTLPLFVLVASDGLFNLKPAQKSPAP